MFERGEEDLLRAEAGGVGVFLGVGDEFFGEPLRFLGFGPGRHDGFVLDEGSDEVAEEGLSVRRVSAEVSVFHVAARHGGEIVLGGERMGKEGRGGWNLLGVET